MHSQHKVTLILNSPLICSKYLDRNITKMKLDDTLLFTTFVIMQMRIRQKENETYKFHPLEPKFMRNHNMVNEDDFFI